MGRLPTFRRILTEELSKLPKEVREGLQPLIGTLNNFMEVVYEGFNRNITFDQNIACFIKELTYRTPSTYPAMEDTKFISELKTKATGVVVIQALDKGTYTPIQSIVYAPWEEINGQILIKPILGLAPSTTYIVRLLVF